MGVEFLKNHIALSSADQINNICEPLLKLGINYFSFVRSYKDGSHIRLSNNPAWTEHYYAREFYNVVIKQVPDGEGNLLWSNIDRYPLFHDASEFFNVDNGTVLVVTADDVVERYFFGSTRENRHVNYIYHHKLDILKKFILYFKEVASPLIDKASKSKIIVPQRSIDNDSEYFNDAVIAEFLNDIKIKKVFIRTRGEDMYVSPGDAKILTLMKCGHTNKEIAKEIGITEKTVKNYSDNLRIKLKQPIRTSLVSLAHNHSLLDMKILS